MVLTDAANPVQPLVFQLRATLALTAATRSAEVDLMRRRYRPSYVRDAMLRMILVEYGEGRLRHMSFYRATLPPHCGRTTVLREFTLLRDTGVVHLEQNPSDRRGMLVVPTERFVTWARENVPRLAGCPDGSEREEVRS